MKGSKPAGNGNPATESKIAAEKLSLPRKWYRQWHQQSKASSIVSLAIGVPSIILALVSVVGANQSSSELIEVLLNQNQQIQQTPAATQDGKDEQGYQGYQTSEPATAQSGILDGDDTKVLYSYCNSTDRRYKPRASCTATIDAIESAGQNYVILNHSAAKYYRDLSYYGSGSKETPKLSEGNEYTLGLRRDKDCHRARSFSRKKTCVARVLIAAVAVKRDKRDEFARLVDKGDAKLSCYYGGNQLACQWAGLEYQSEEIGSMPRTGPSMAMARL